MNIYILLLIISLLVLFSYYLNRKDIMAPPVLLILGYFLSALCCIYNKDNWGVDLKFTTCGLIIVGILSFCLGDILFRLNYKIKPLSADVMVPPKEIKISSSVIILFTVYNLFVLFLFLREILQLTGGLIVTLGNTIGKYRYAYSHTEYRGNPINIQLLKISKGAAYTFLYAFINNTFIIRKPTKKNIVYLGPVISFVIITLIKGGRINALMIIMSSLFFSYYLWHKKKGWEVSISFKFVNRILIAFIAFTILFFSSRELVGRKETNPFMEYLTTYMGGSYQLLDQYLDRGVSSDNLETFQGIVQSLNKLGILSKSYHQSLEFRYSPTGVYLGNVYTGLRRYYHDFGMVGMILIQVVYGFFFSWMYSKIKRMKYLNSNRLFLLIIYGSLLFCIVTQSIEDHFWIDLSLGFIIELMIVYVIIKLIMDFHIGKNLKIVYNKWDERKIDT